MSIINNTNYAHKEAVVINLSISAISGETQIDFKKMGVEVEELPQDARKLLKEKTLPQTFVDPYSKLRSEATGEMERGRGSITTPLGAVMSKAEAVKRIGKLKDIKQKWLAQIEADKQIYPMIVSNHCHNLLTKLLEGGATPSQAAMVVAHVEKRQPSWAEMERRLRFAYTTNVISLDESGFDADLYEAQAEGLVSIRQGVIGSALQFVAHESSQILKVLEDVKPSPNGEMAVNKRTTDRAKAIADKLESLSFIHAQLGHVAIELRSAFGCLNGAMPFGTYSDFKQCLMSLSNQIILWEKLEQGLPLITKVISNPAQYGLLADEEDQAAPVKTGAPKKQRSNRRLANVQPELLQPQFINVDEEEEEEEQETAVELTVESNESTEMLVLPTTVGFTASELPEGILMF